MNFHIYYSIYKILNHLAYKGNEAYIHIKKKKHYVTGTKVVNNSNKEGYFLSHKELINQLIRVKPITNGQLLYIEVLKY